MRAPTIVSLLILLSFALAGCGRNPASKGQPKPKEPSQQAQAPEEKKPPPKVEGPTVPPKIKSSQLIRFRDLISLRLWFKDMGTAYMTMATPPKSKEDFRRHPINPELMKMIDDGYVVFIYNVGPLQAADKIIAYEVWDDPTARRLVLMGSGEVHEMNNEEFKKAPKANGK